MPKLSDEQQALSEVLKDARAQAKLTQRELASRLERGQSIVGLIELGERQVSVLEFIQIARALKIEPTKLLAKVVQATGM
ncbi:helix-turn-helix transcriptional regulator [Povalibacter sp.]|uniref:helix-turn-helix domain-containing protein n=1 Tax=Povalibacter sp. TaxID=1962978 RepID=UPI002F41F7BD